MLLSKHILIIHYHFKKGGITDVISEAIKAFDFYKTTTQITLASGNTDKETNETIASLGILKNISIKSDYIDALGYFENFTKTNYDSTSHNIYSMLERFFTRHTNHNTLWWVHNHHIGKNPLFTKALVEHLEISKQRCILHMHDFPEQARFSNLKALQKVLPLSSCYKAFACTQYAVINSTDAGILHNSGMHAHYIPNIVKQSTSSRLRKKSCDIHAFLHTLSLQYAHKSKKALLFTYPVRCIRRKNALEAALITKLYEAHTHIPCNYNITLPGESEQEKHYSSMIQSLFEERIIHGFFSLGTDPRNTLSLAEVCGASNLILSSSIQEGFGFSYLRSVLWRCPLLARHIASVKDSASILRLWNVYWYNEISIPLFLLSSAELLCLRDAYEQQIKESRSIAGYTHQHVCMLKRELHAMITETSIDFSFLPASIQVRLIRDFVHHQDVLLQANKKLMEETKSLVQSKKRLTDKKIQHTQKVIEQRFGKRAFIKTFTTTAKSTKNNKALHDPHSVAHATLKAHAHLSSLRTSISLYET